MWLLVVPLLAFFYLGSNTTTRLVVFAQIAAVSAHSIWPICWDQSFPSHIPIENMVGIGIISAMSASIYVFLMASYYAQIVDSQSELLREIDAPPGDAEGADRWPRTTPSAPTAPSPSSWPR